MSRQASHCMGTQVNIWINAILNHIDNRAIFPRYGGSCTICGPKGYQKKEKKIEKETTHQPRENKLGMEVLAQYVDLKDTKKRKKNRLKKKQPTNHEKTNKQNKTKNDTTPMLVRYVSECMF